MVFGRDSRGKGKAVDDTEAPRRRVRGGHSGRVDTNNEEDVYVPEPPVPITGTQMTNEELERILEIEMPGEGVSGDFFAGMSDLERQMHELSGSGDDNEDARSEQTSGRGRARRRSRKAGFDVQVEDVNGTPAGTRRLDVVGCNELPHNLRISVGWNPTTKQPTEEGGNLLNRYCARLGWNFRRFPISYKSWNQVPVSYKVAAFREDIQNKFAVDETRLRYINLKLGSNWKNKRKQLADKYAPRHLSLEQAIQNVPDGVEPNEWEAFIRHRRSPMGEHLSMRGTQSRAQQTLLHTGGSKAFAITYSEIERKARAEGQQAHYGMLYDATHRKGDGSAINPEAEETIARINEIATQLVRESQEAESSGSAREIDPVAPLRGPGLQPDRPGRVRGLGLGATPTMVFGRGQGWGGTQSRGQPSRQSQLNNEVREAISSYRNDQDNWLKQMNDVLSTCIPNFPGLPPPPRVPSVLLRHSQGHQSTDPATEESVHQSNRNRNNNDNNPSEDPPQDPPAV